jgi:hypothetical protein
MEVASQAHIVAEDIQHPDHLAKDKHAMAVLAKSREELVEEDQFARVHDEPFEDFLVRIGTGLGTIKEIWVVGGLFKFHGDVEQTNVAISICTLDQS